MPQWYGADPFVCKEPPFVQPTPEGRAFFVWGKDSNDAIANVPETFEDGTAAVPGEAVHSWDHDASALVQDWFDPQLVMGLYNGKYCVCFEEANCYPFVTKIFNILHLCWPFFFYS